MKKTGCAMFVHRFGMLGGAELVNDVSQSDGLTVIILEGAANRANAAELRSMAMDVSVAKT